jgi:tetratricopeptide (TPR) repeat protein
VSIQPSDIDPAGMGIDRKRDAGEAIHVNRSECRPFQEGRPLIAIIYEHKPMTVGRMFKAGLSQLDVNMVSIGGFGGSRVGWPIERTHEDYLDVPDIVVEMERFYKASYIVGKIVDKFKMKPSLILQIDGDTHVCNDLVTDDIIFVSIATDPHMPSPTYAHAAECSAYFYCMQTSYMHLFGDRARYIPYGYDPMVHFMEPAEKIYDVVCIGFQFAARAEFGRMLAGLGLRVRFENGPVFDEYRRIINQSWICFNLSAKDDLNMRVFETLACGTFLVSNITTDMGKFFNDGVHYVAYSDLDDARDKILYYLGNREELEKIAGTGHEAVKPYTYANRLRQLFKEVGLIHAGDNKAEISGATGSTDAAHSIERLFDSALQLIDQLRFEYAILVLRFLLDRDQMHGPAHHKLALLYFEAGREEDALRHFELADRYVPDNPDTMKNLANLYFSMGRTENALELFERLAQLLPNDGESQVAAAKLSLLRGKRKEAVSFFHRALAIDPDNAEARSYANSIEKSHGRDSFPAAQH